MENNLLHDVRPTQETRKRPSWIAENIWRTPCWCEKPLGSEQNSICRKSISMFLDLEKNRQQQRKLQNPKSLGGFRYRQRTRYKNLEKLKYQQKNTFVIRLCTITKTCISFYWDAKNLEEELGTENLDHSRTQALCSTLEQLITKLDSTHAAFIQIKIPVTLRIGWRLHARLKIIIEGG